MSAVPQRLKHLRYLIVAPAFCDWDLGHYCERLLRDDDLDCTIYAYGDHPDAEQERRLLEAVRRRRPHVIIALKLQGIGPRTVAALREQAFVALWYVDCFSDEVPRWLSGLLAHVDLFLTSAKGMIPAYRSHTAAPIHWVYEGAHLPSFPRLPPAAPVPGAYRSQVAFVGNVRHTAPPVPSARARLLLRVHRHFDLRIWGPQGLPADAGTGRLRVTEWPAYNRELVRVCVGAAIVLGINEVNSVPLYFSNRTFLTLACGGFHLTRYVPGLERMFVNRRHLVWFHSDAECLELIRYYLDRPRARRAIARAGRVWTRRRYGMRRSWRRILAAIDAAYPRRRG
jgi:hypothetical protein